MDLLLSINNRLCVSACGHSVIFCSTQTKTHSVSVKAEANYRENFC